MTTITGTYKTYSMADGRMKHTGYFIITNNYRMKYATKWQWENVKPSHLELYLDRVIQSLTNAQ